PVALDARHALGVAEERPAAGGVAGVLLRELLVGPGVELLGPGLEEPALARRGVGEGELPAAARVRALHHDEVPSRLQRAAEMIGVPLPAVVVQVLEDLQAVE